MSSNAEQILKTQIIEKAWSDPVFKKQLLEDPKAAIHAAFGVEIPENIKLTVVEETANSFYLVIPPSPQVDKARASQTTQGW
ncbi:NHLP leader peptide family RiPP precursor [Paenibacillus xylaniclasticus]|uniref:NHLP leader peptide family RiPP precursor n=1 Tax=Paenibacillus xylaniclasticus TaxID=588083 RepID=UPI000FD719B9|nr:MULTISPECIES: NHLP leader peptide family RiPP precursor [Paenibacillus]GFN32988.1 hypothetical protein PCURB6_32480 [Paenibacillus curdlanolyticus]